MNKFTNYFYVIIVAIFLTSCASSKPKPDLKVVRYASIAPHLITKIEFIEKKDALEIIMASDTTLRYRVTQDKERNRFAIEFPYVVLSPQLADIQVNHPYVTNFNIMQLSESPDILRFEFEFSKGLKTKTLLSSNGEKLKISIYDERIADIENDSTYKVYKLVYADSKDSSDILRRMIPYGDNKVQVDERTNSLVVNKQGVDIKSIDKLISKIDKPRQQVLIEAEIIEVNSDFLKNIGFSFPATVSSTFQETQDAPPSFDMVDLALQDFVRTPLELLLTFNMLKEEGKARVLSNPRITTLDGVEAKVATVERLPYFITEIQANYTYITKQEFTAGVELKITPRVNSDGKITTKILTAVSAITGTTSQGYPQTSSRETETIVRIEAGQTIIISGLLEDREISYVTQVPLLGDIPILGALFRNKKKEKNQMELFILITPYLIEDGTI